MRLIIQRVSEASVIVGDSTAGAIRTGLVVLVGIAKSDDTADADYLADKLLGLRIFPDDFGKMNRNIAQAQGALLIISQFTLYADCRKGRRPSFDQAAPPERAQALYNYFVDTLRRGPVPVETGIFQAMMEVQLVNQGPVTILLDSADRSNP
ncbi:MAG TPA: D-aminoacyl-tRNA deacylase [Candidatus Acidoferrales bacterium]|nr:D-aminoacyl-tRNA deacylase [Candidatus Acidoferrales bacterium]